MSANKISIEDLKKLMELSINIEFIIAVKKPPRVRLCGGKEMTIEGITKKELMRLLDDNS